MKKQRIPALVTALALILSVTTAALAVTPRWNSTFSCDGKLNFTGTTANCFVSIIAEDSSATIDTTVKLLRGGTPVATWPLKGTGYATLTETAPAASGQGYTLVVTGTVTGPNGTDNLYEYASATCP